MNHFPKPGSPEFARLPKHVQKRALENYGDEKQFRRRGYSGTKPNSGSNHIKAEDCLPIGTKSLWQ